MTCFVFKTVVQSQLEGLTRYHDTPINFVEGLFLLDMVAPKQWMVRKCGRALLTLNLPELISIDKMLYWKDRVLVTDSYTLCD